MMNTVRMASKMRLTIYLPTFFTPFCCFLFCLPAEKQRLKVSVYYNGSLRIGQSFFVCRRHFLNAAFAFSPLWQ